VSLYKLSDSKKRRAPLKECNLAERGTRTEIDLGELEKLAGVKCTDEEVAAWFGVSTRTIRSDSPLQALTLMNDEATRNPTPRLAVPALIAKHSEVWLSLNLNYTGLRPGHLFYQVEECAFAFGVDAPVHRHCLISISIRIEVSPRSVSADGLHHVIGRFVEVEVIVLVEQDRHGPIGRHLSRLLHHFGDPVGIGDTIAVEQQEIRGLDDVRGGDRRRSSRERHVVPPLLRFRPPRHLPRAAVAI
jgi:hypothetical protein